MFRSKKLNSENCPVGVAWSDKAYAADTAHQLTECSNAGSCDRKSGLCNCYGGFTGNACQRSLCPNGCNGNGICTLVRDLSRDHVVDVADDDKITIYNEATNLGLGEYYNFWDARAMAVCMNVIPIILVQIAHSKCVRKGMTRTVFIKNIVRLIWQYEKQIQVRCFQGNIHIRFHGSYTSFSLTTADLSSACTSAFLSSDEFAVVFCSCTKVSNVFYNCDLTFKSWPLFPTDNNVYTHNGNPAA